MSCVGPLLQCMFLTVFLVVTAVTWFCFPLHFLSYVFKYFSLNFTSKPLESISCLLTILSFPVFCISPIISSTPAFYKCKIYWPSNWSHFFIYSKPCVPVEMSGVFRAVMGFRVWLHCYLLKASVSFSEQWWYYLSWWYPQASFKAYKRQVLWKAKINTVHASVESLGALGEMAWLFHRRPAGGTHGQARP